MPAATDVDATVNRIEALLEELGQADPQLRERAEELVRLLLQLYGSGFARALEILGPEAAAQLAQDKLLGSILLLHGLHPADAAARITEALRRIERRLDGHRVVLAEVSADVARIRVERNGGPLPPGLREAIEQAVAEAAPDVAGLAIEGLPQTLVRIAPAVSR